MPIQLYDLAGAEDNRRFSPPCWQVKLALQHKGLEVEEIPWRYGEKDAIAFSGQGAVPVLVDQGKTVVDSWAIVEYLETTYGDRPSLFGGTMGKSGALFTKFWCMQAMSPLIMRIIVLDLFQHLHENDKSYFRQTREQRFGMTLEAFAAADAATINTFRTGLTPLREVLTRQPYLCGDQPYFADFVVLAQFLWARAMSPVQLLVVDDPIYDWRNRLFDHFDGYISQYAGYPV